MIALLCLIISSSALKLQQDPEFDVTDAVYDEECGNRYNYKCWKKGGHSLDKKDSTTTAAVTTTAEGGNNKQEEATTTAPATNKNQPKFSIVYGSANCAGSVTATKNVNHRGQPKCDTCYEWSSDSNPTQVNYVMFKNFAFFHRMYTFTHDGTAQPTGCEFKAGIVREDVPGIVVEKYEPGRTCQVIGDSSDGTKILWKDADGCQLWSQDCFGLSMSHYDFPTCEDGR